MGVEVPEFSVDSLQSVLRAWDGCEMPDMGVEDLR